MFSKDQYNSIENGEFKLIDSSFLRKTAARSQIGKRAKAEVLSDKQVKITDSEGKVYVALQANILRFPASSVRVIQSFLGVPQTGSFDEKTILCILHWQSNSDWPQTGKIDKKGHIKGIFDDLVGQGKKASFSGLIMLAVDFFDISKAFFF